MTFAMYAMFGGEIDLDSKDLKDTLYPICKDCGKSHDPTNPSYECLDAEGKAAFHIILDMLEKDPKIGRQINKIRENIDRL
tara:strand:- start:168 stop:410 length:243 start_codon:yes stop_codon:yes gene_type:complete